MIQAILTSLKPVMTAMSWVDRYAALAIPVTRSVVKEVPGGYSQEAHETWPVACDVDMKRCWETGDYADLVPNSHHKSVLYWEDLTGLKEVTRRRISGGRELSTMEATLRLVCWLNMKKLGYESCEGTLVILQDVIRTLRNVSVDVSGIEGVKNASFRLNEMVRRDLQLIFGQYAYAGRSDLFVYPYDFFAIQVQLRVVMSSECVGVLTPQAEIVC